MLNKIWGGFFFIAFGAGLYRWLVQGEPEVWQEMVTASFDMARTGFEISIGLTGVMCLWLGVMEVGQRGGAVRLLSKAFGPLLVRLFRGVPADHPAMGSMVMNLAANMLGLDNAATPLGLKAMRELQTLNPAVDGDGEGASGRSSAPRRETALDSDATDAAPAARRATSRDVPPDSPPDTPSEARTKAPPQGHFGSDTASDAQILFLVLNTSAVTIIPSTLFVYRSQLGAADPTDVFIPIIVATFCSTMAGLLITAVVQKIRLWEPVVMAYLGAMTAFIVGLVVYFQSLAREQMEAQSALLSNFVIFSLIIGIFALAAARRVPLYEAFVDGAKEGFGVAVTIIPYLVAMLVAIGVLRASGTLDFVLDLVRGGVGGIGLDTRWVDGLPTALMRPLSGGGSRGLMLETMESLGADSFAGRLVSILQGSTETTFYVLAVYFGAVGVKRTRHALPCGLFADLVGIVASISVCYLFFG